ncbi:MAG: tRNA pseudouridine(55) synthase TruB [Chloroflexi bacterium]|nr:tRNA pseudouridine(55) synthase TruB [Chloroflexota bacterium]
MEGFLNVWKPKGLTSFGAVARIRRATKTKRVGHGGTLDPLAEGVLPVLLGKATRLAPLLVGMAKVYVATIELGRTTDTLDTEGEDLERRPFDAVGQEQVEALLPTFTGEILQRPPMFSAVKQHGQRLYSLARKGIEVERPPRPVRVHQIRLLHWAPPSMTLEVVCGKGTYIRVLAADMGEALGCGATLTGLVRSRFGPFRGEAAILLETAETLLAKGEQRGVLLPLGYPFEEWPAVHLAEEQASQVAMGWPVKEGEGRWTASSAPDLLYNPPLEGTALAYTPTGELLAVLTRVKETGEWRPRTVLV